MNGTTERYDVCIVGTGRVGLPLGLSLIDVGLKVVGVDVDPELRAKVNGGEMPFAEPGYDDLVARRALTVEATLDVVAQSDAVVVTVGMLSQSTTSQSQPAPRRRGGEPAAVSIPCNSSGPAA